MQMIKDGLLSVGSGHQIYFHEYGSPDGDPILVFHGGPGNYSKPKHAGLFNPEKHRVILFDQRGCGKSTYLDRYKDNSIDHTADDAATILDHLGISMVNVVSSSWGSACALNFAKRHKNYVKKMILSNIFLARQSEIDWLTGGWRDFYPDLYEFVYKNDSFKDFCKQVMSDNQDDVVHSTKLFGSAERQLGGLFFCNETIREMEEYTPSEEHIHNYRMYMYYVANGMTVKEPILENIDILNDLDITIVHNRLDFNSLFVNAWDLHKALPASKLIISSDIGHDSEKLKECVKELIHKELQ